MPSDKIDVYRDAVPAHVRAELDRLVQRCDELAQREARRRPFVETATACAFMFGVAGLAVASGAGALVAASLAAFVAGTWGFSKLAAGKGSLG